jgi:hypothetical protein
VRGALSFTFQGNLISLAYVNGDVEIAFTDWVEMECLDDLRRRREKLGDEYDYFKRLWKQSVDAGDYEWTGYISYRKRQSLVGQKHLLWLLIRAAGSMLFPADVDAILADPGKKEELLNDDTGLYWRALAPARPTSPAPKTEPEKSTG